MLLSLLLKYFFYYEKAPIKQKIANDKKNLKLEEREIRKKK